MSNCIGVPVISIENEFLVYYLHKRLLLAVLMSVAGPLLLESCAELPAKVMEVI